MSEAVVSETVVSETVMSEAIISEAVLNTKSAWSEPGLSALPLVIGVVADTHVPDRVNVLHPALLPSLRSAGVDLILHAGDICSPTVLDALGEVAPVRAVGGNRDLMLPGQLPQMAYFDFQGVATVLMHGHGSWRQYFRDKLQYILEGGYSPARYEGLALRLAPDARLIIFGHTHRAVNRMIGRQQLFNPGSASCPPPDGRPPTFGLLRISAGTVAAEIVPLRGAHRVGRRWVDD